MSLTESLTVEINADSQDLESELSRVGSLIDGLSGRLQSVSAAVGAAGGRLSSLGAATGPVNALAAAIGSVREQLAAIGQTPVTINVSPALASLAQLSSAIAGVAAQLQALNASGGAPRTGPSGGGPPGVGTGPTAGAVARFARGGFVSGPAGRDRVPAYVTAGEFVVRPEVVTRLGRPFFEQLNAGDQRAAGAIAETDSDPGLSRTSTSSGVAVGDTGRGATVVRSSGGAMSGPIYQDITIHMSHAVEMDDVLDQVELNALRNTHRFG